MVDLKQMALLSDAKGIEYDIEKCPKCGHYKVFMQWIDGKKNYALNAVSRRDDETYICSDCGIVETFEDYSNFSKSKQ